MRIARISRLSSGSRVGAAGIVGTAEHIQGQASGSNPRTIVRLRKDAAANSVSAGNIRADEPIANIQTGVE